MAQWIEHRSTEPGVGGSSPPGSANKIDDLRALTRGPYFVVATYVATHGAVGRWRVGAKSGRFSALRARADGPCPRLARAARRRRPPARAGRRGFPSPHDRARAARSRGPAKRARSVGRLRAAPDRRPLPRTPASKSLGASRAACSLGRIESRSGSTRRAPIIIAPSATVSSGVTR